MQVRSLEDPWSRKWQPTPVFLPENSMDKEAEKSWTQLST